MSDMISRDDAIKVARSLFRLQTSGLYGAAGVDGYGLLTDTAERAIRAIPATDARAEALLKRAAQMAYEVWDDPEALAKAILALIPETKPQAADQREGGE